LSLYLLMRGTSAKELASFYTHLWSVLKRNTVVTKIVINTIQYVSVHNTMSLTEVATITLGVDRSDVSQLTILRQLQQ
jgi:hypothetical protein